MASTSHDDLKIQNIQVRVGKFCKKICAIRCIHIQIHIANIYKIYKMMSRYSIRLGKDSPNYNQRWQPLMVEVIKWKWKIVMFIKDNFVTGSMNLNSYDFTSSWIQIKYWSCPTITLTYNEIVFLVRYTPTARKLTFTGGVILVHQFTSDLV